MAFKLCFIVISFALIMLSCSPLNHFSKVSSDQNLIGLSKIPKIKKDGFSTPSKSGDNPISKYRCEFDHQVTMEYQDITTDSSSEARSYLMTFRFTDGATKPVVITCNMFYPLGLIGSASSDLPTPTNCKSSKAKDHEFDPDVFMSFLTFESKDEGLKIVMKHSQSLHTEQEKTYYSGICPCLENDKTFELQ